MPHEVIMPALGMAQETGLIVAWRKAEGDAVAEGEILLEVETDKATMEVEAQASGFLTSVGADAGAEVPVGDVIATISESATESASPGASETAKDTAMPEGRAVIMPALGMAQDTGLVVAWHKAPGDPVAAGDVLFEVETDKSTVEVEAGHDGFIAAVLAEAGEEAPVGETIAIISAEKPSAPVRQGRAGAGTAPVQAPAPAPAPPPRKPSGSAPAAPERRPAVSADGRILCSPKARRLAREQGLDLRRLVDAGHPQPYHVADLEVLRAMPASAATAAQATARHLTARLAEDGFAAFAHWAAAEEGLNDPPALLAGLAASSLKPPASRVAVETFGAERIYAVTAGPLGAVTPNDEHGAPDLRLRDLRMSRVASVTHGEEDVPTLTLTRDGAGLTITLECAAGHLTASQATDLLTNFAGRMEQPLRALL